MVYADSGGGGVAVVGTVVVGIVATDREGPRKPVSTVVPDIPNWKLHRDCTVLFLPVTSQERTFILNGIMRGDLEMASL